MEKARGIADTKLALWECDEPKVVTEDDGGETCTCKSVVCSSNGIEPASIHDCVCASSSTDTIPVG